MIAWQKRDYPACPNCGSVRVDVPASLLRRRGRRFWGIIIYVLLASLPCWALSGLILHVQWPRVGFALSALSTALLAMGYRRSQTIHLCLDCRRRWRPPASSA